MDVKFPEMGDSVAEGTVLEWLKQVGDSVAVDDPLVEISTDKVDAEVPSPTSGTLAEILVEADETVGVGTILCRIASGPVGPGDGRPAAGDSPEAEKAAPAAPTNGNGQATPVAARIATAHGIDVSSLQGSGPRGRVTKSDVLAAVEGDGASAAEATPIRGPAATLARFMNESRSIPTATSFRTVPVDVLDSQRKALKAAGRKLSFTHLIAWAIVRAVADDWPVMGNSYEEVDGKPHRVAPDGVSLGLAVDVERKDGSRSLIVPVIRDAGALGFADFAQQLRRAGGGRARQHSCARGLPGRQHHPHQSRRARHRRLGAAADARPGDDRRHRLDRLPARDGERRPRARSRSSASRR